MMQAGTEEDNIKLQKVISMAQVGWWEADFTKMIYRCSPFVADLLELEGDTISFSDFHYLIREDYRERIIAEFISFRELDIYEQVFPIHSKHGITWVSTKVGEKSIAEDGSTRVFGILQCVSRQKMNLQEQTVNRMSEMLYQQNSISRSLLEFLQKDDTSQIIHKILKDILTQFRGDRAYIFEYDRENDQQHCVYEITASGVTSEKDNLQNISIDATGWWSKQLLNGSPITLSTLDDLPPEAIYDKQLLEAQDIKSVMALPLYSKHGVWGYIGIDIIKEYRNWNNEDYLWFVSLANIISICMELHKAEEKANTEKLYLHNLYKHMPVGYLRLKIIYQDNIPVDYIYLDANQAYEKIMEKPFIRGSRVLNEKSETDGIRERISYLFEVANSNTYREVNFHLKDINKVCHSIMYSPQQDEVVIMFSDMTETFATHEALDRSEKILRNIYKNLPVGIELYDKEGYLVDINDKELEIFGLKEKKDALGVNLFENPVIPPELKETIKEKKPIDFSFKYNFNRVNEYYETSRKGIIDLITKITPLFDSSDRLINYLFINIDNTETSNAYSKIQEFENFFTLVGDFAKVGYAHFDALTRDGYAISSWYKNVGEKEGTPLPEIIGIHSHFHPEDRPIMLAFLDKVLKGEATYLRHDIRILREDGPYTWTRVNVIVRDYRPEDGIIEMVCINYDITELKETERKLIEAKDKAETLDRLKSAFLANMSHEIRTPLNAIVGFSNLLAETEDLDERKQYIAIVQKNNELLLQLITDILDLSKIEAGTFEFVKGDIDVNQLCNEIVYSFKMKASPEIKIIFEDHLPECHIWGDKNRLTQVISNFINNALKFTPSGSISLGYHLLNNNELKFYVRDTGIGIPANKINSIFDRFVKLNTFVNGTGLGLSICKSIVEQMEGTIGVESEEEKGSCFWFTHPYQQKSPQNTNQNSHEPKRLELANGIKPKLLIAEDTDSNYLLISAILKKDYELKRAHNGKEVVQLHESYSPDIILMDVKMPEMDGLEATSEIRKKDKNTPIIAVTAYAFDQDKQRLLEIGCNDYLSKPIARNTLIETINKWL